MAHDLVELDIDYTYDHKFHAGLDNVFDVYMACMPPIGSLKKMVVVSKSGPWGHKDMPLTPELFQEGAKLKATYGFLFGFIKREMMFEIRSIQKDDSQAEVIMDLPDQSYAGYEKFSTRCRGVSKVTIERHTDTQCLFRSSVELKLIDFPEYFIESFSVQSEKYAKKQFSLYTAKLEKMLR